MPSVEPVGSKRMLWWVNVPDPSIHWLPMPCTGPETARRLHCTCSPVFGALAALRDSRRCSDESMPSTASRKTTPRIRHIAAATAAVIPSSMRLSVPQHG